MGEAVHEGVANVKRSGRASLAGASAPATALHLRLVDQALRKAPPATWSSSLNSTDLACLMSVIELQVLPRLLREYRPADRAPLRASWLA